MERSQVYKLIDGERDYQDKKWNDDTTISGGRHYQPEEWITYMEDYLAEAKHVLSRKPAQISIPEAMGIIRKVTALGVNAMEHIDTPPRE